MAQYLILIYGDESQAGDMTPESWQEMLGLHDAFAKDVVDKGGTIVAGGALQPSSTATSVRDGAVLSDGPFLTVKEQLAGYYHLEVADLDVALELARRCPSPGGGVELRPVLDTSH
jgi:hypothetical protein